MPEVLTQVDPDDLPPNPSPISITSVKREAEHQRLERNVIEAAKAELAAYGAPGDFGWTTNYHAARQKLWKATRVLINFESQQIKK